MKKIAITVLLLLATAFASTAQTTKKNNGSEFALRANLLYVPVGVPFLGFEWKPVQKFGILVNGAFAPWQWKDGERSLQLWQVNPELRYYINHCWYVGISAEKGEFDIKLNDNKGRDGDFWGGGFTFGYKARLNRSLDLDLHLSMGYAEYEYDYYNRTDGQDVPEGIHQSRYLWGPYQGGVTLSWKICK